MTVLGRKLKTVIFYRGGKRMSPTIDDLMRQVETYADSESIKMIMRAYKEAEYLHRGVKRQSGEPYIIHPVYVAYLKSLRQADRDTICACLLHDTIEDTDIKKETIIRNFTEDVGILVDGVSKISKLEFSSKEEAIVANIRKLVIGLAVDPRIILIKTSDRLHNMRTLEYKTPAKQKENAQETMDIYVPLTEYLRDNDFQVELRDLSLMYLEREKYNKAKEIRDKITEESKDCLTEMTEIINRSLNKEGIKCLITPRVKSIYGISKYLEEDCNLATMNDLLALKIVPETFSECYQALGVIHREFKPVPGRMKDYICNPKTNFYQSLHTTVFGIEGRQVQAQIRTPKMHKVAAKGLSAYWEFYGENAKNYMREELERKSQFYSYLLEADNSIKSNKAFVDCLKTELFASHIHVFDQVGDVIELPIGSNPIDFAYKLDPDTANYLTSASVNGEQVPLDYRLKNEDRVKVTANMDFIGPPRDLEAMASTGYAKRKIKEFRRS